MKRWLVGLCFSLAACQPAPVGVHNVELQRDSTAQCAAQCQQIGLSLDSVVIMAARVGCVCRAVQPVPPSMTPSANAAASGTAGGVTAVMIDEEAAAAYAAQQQRQQQQRQTPSYQPPKY